MLIDQNNRSVGKALKNAGRLVKPLANKFYPIVSFSYPTGWCCHKRQFVRVSEMNATHIKGYEIPFKEYGEDGVFKSFIIARVIGNITFHP